jgi:putative FmdB family regulatory protein
MPTYEYGCASCQHEWEFEQSIKDAPITECPVCHQQTAKRQISGGGGFILKGGGWYSDLYSSPSNKPSGDKPAGEKSSTDKPSGDTSTKSSPSEGGTSGGSTSEPSGSSSPTKSSTSAAA